MRLVCVIPARLGSTRLPGKPLRLLAGEPLVRRVARRVAGFGLGAEVVVATDHRDVADAVRGLAVTPVLTDPRCSSGTERVWQVAQRPEYRDAELILNVQGDEPLVARAAVTGAVDQVRDGADIGTAAGWLAPAAVRDPNKVKVGVNLRGRATRFLRTLQGTSCPHHGEALFHHIGVYAYRRAALQRWAALPPVPEERLERLEQLRPLLHGMSIGVSPLEDAPAPGVDTAGDLEDVEHLLAAAGPGMDG